MTLEARSAEIWRRAKKRRKPRGRDYGDVGPKPWEASTDYKLGDQVTIRVEEGFIVLRCIKPGRKGSNTPEPPVARSHATGEKYRTQPNKIVDGGRVDY